jgi:uncharacterized membrane protein YfcA
MIEPFLLLLLGIVMGILGGYLGIGGAALIIPVFLELLKNDVADDAMRFKLAFGSSLLAITGSALISPLRNLWEDLR